MITELEREAVQIVRDIVRSCLAEERTKEGFYNLSEDGVDERLFAARIEQLAKDYAAPARRGERLRQGKAKGG